MLDALLASAVSAADAGAVPAVVADHIEQARVALPVNWIQVSSGVVLAFIAGLFRRTLNDLDKRIDAAGDAARSSRALAEQTLGVLPTLRRTCDETEARTVHLLNRMGAVESRQSAAEPLLRLCERCLSERE